MENSEVLKLLGINDSNKWILQDASQFFTWISENLDSSNILTEHEFLASLDLKDTSDDELKKLRDIELEFPGFFSITEEDLIEKQKELAILEDEINERNDRILRMEEHERNEIKTLAKVLEEITECDLETKFLTEQVNTKVEKLENLRKSNANKVEAYDKHLLQSAQTFMYQMPSDTYLTMMNKFCINLNAFMRHNIKVRKVNDFHETDLIPVLTKEKNKIADIEGKLLENDINSAGIKYAMENFDEYLKFFKPNTLETNVIIDDWNNEEQIMKEQFEVMMQELQILVCPNSQSSKILDEYGGKKHAQNVEVLKKLTHAQIITDDVASISCALWCASQLDSKRLENRVDNSEKAENEVYETRKRICHLERINKNNRKDSYKNFILRSLQDALRKYLSLSTEKLDTVESCIGEILRYQERLNTLTDSIVHQKYFTKTASAIKDIEVQIFKLQPYIYSGPHYKPCLYDSTFFVQIHAKDKRKKELEAQFQEIRSHFQNKVTDPFNNDKFFRMKELLCTWFLTEPRKVILAVKEVQKQAAEGGSSSYKALNVTINVDKSKLN